MYHVVQEVKLWLTESSRMFFVLGEAGIGKSAISAAIVKAGTQSEWLLGAFFCKFSDRKQSSASNLIKSVAYQIAQKLPSLKDTILKMSDELEVSLYCIAIVFE